MQGIFAEAYQMSQGRSPADMKRGQKAIEELNGAMEKGQVISAKILPYVAEIAKRMAEPGLAEARQASFAEQNRFSNQMSEGWKLFREGGAEEGIAHFWRMMQGFGDWWIGNGTQLGMYFKSAVLYLDAFQESIGELFKFAATGESTSITELFKRNGLDVDGIRTSLLELKNSIVSLLGLNEGGDGFSTISKRIIQFANDLTKIADAITLMIRGVEKLIFSTPGASRQTEADSLRADPKNLFRNEGKFALDRMENGIANGRVGGFKDIITGGLGGTWDGLSALKGLFVGSSDAGTFKPTSSTPYMPISLSSPQGSIPSMGPVDPSSITGGTRASQFVNHRMDMTLRLEGNPDAINMLFDAKAREVFPTMLANEVAKSMVSAPIR